MRNLLKNILAVALVITLVGFNVASVSAAGSTGVTTEEALRLQLATGGNVKLDADITLNSPITIGGDAILDLNNKTITGSVDLISSLFVINNGSSLVVNNGDNTSHDGTITGAYGTDLFRNKGNLKLNGGTYGGDNEGNYKGLYYIYPVGDHATFTEINNGVFYTALYTNGTYKNGNLGTHKIVINGGTFYQQTYLASGQTDLEINGGEFDLRGDHESIIEIDGGNLHIKGGTFTADLDTSKNIDITDMSSNGSGPYKGLFVVAKPAGTSETGYKGSITVNIEGGTFENKNEKGDYLVLANHSDPSLGFAISATVKNGVIPYAGIAKYDFEDSPASVFDLSYRVVFEDINGAVLSDTNVLHGGDVTTVPNIPVIVGKNIIGWDRVFTNVTSNLTIKPLYAPITYDVTFKYLDAKGDTVTTVVEGVEHGKSATAPVLPTVDGKTFDKWDKAFDVVTSNLTVTATYKDVVIEEPVAELDESIKDALDADKVVVNVPSGAFETPVEKFEFTKPELDDKATEALEDQLAKLFEDSTTDITNYFVLTISPLDAAGNKLQVAEGEYVEITIPVPTGLNVNEKFAVFHVNADGTLTELETTYDAETGVITFKATEFSDFVIANVTETTPPADGGEDTLPKTGMAAPLYGVTMAGLGLVALALGKKKSRED